MKKLILPALLLVLTGFVSAQSNKRVTIKNSTGYDMVNLFASAGSEDWNDIDQLGDDLLNNEAQKTIQVNTVTDCEWDFKAVDVDGDEYIKKQDVCENATVEFTIDDIVSPEDEVTEGGDVEAEGAYIEEEYDADAPMEGLDAYDVTFENKTGKEIVIIRWVIDGLQDEMDFSDDVLGEENVLEVGETEEVKFYIPSNTCELVLLFEAEGETNYRKEINICELSGSIQVTRADKLSD